MSAEASSLTFEQALSELEQIVQKLEAGDASLDDAINAYSRGIEL
ncbi:MAG: exodeoxyribonuclease VII small subunit [Alphaproteobacteria bacterium]